MDQIVDMSRTEITYVTTLAFVAGQLSSLLFRLEENPDALAYLEIRGIKDEHWQELRDALAPIVMGFYK